MTEPKIISERWDSEYAPAVERCHDGRKVSAREAAVVLFTGLDWYSITDAASYSETITNVEAWALRAFFDQPWRDTGWHSKGAVSRPLPWITSRLRPTWWCETCGDENDGEPFPYGDCWGDDVTPIPHTYEDVWVLWDADTPSDFLRHVLALIERDGL